jgi:hypothetical protein
VPVTPNIASRTVVIHEVSPDGSAAEGTVRFIPSVDVRDITGHVIVQRAPISVDLDSSGDATIELFVNDDPDSEPQGWTWHVTALLAERREYDILITSDMPDPVYLANLLPVEEVQTVYGYASQIEVANALAELAATEADLTARMDALEVDAGVRHIDVKTSSGTWLCPAGVFAVDLELIGAGGGAGGGGDGAAAFGGGDLGGQGGGGGGGGGAGLRRQIDAVPVVPGTSYAYVVGAGGAGGAAAVNGSAGGYTQMLGYRTFGGAGGVGGADGSGAGPNSGAGGSGASPSGGRGGTVAGSPIAASAGGSFGFAAPVGGTDASLPGPEAPGGGAGGGAGSAGVDGSVTGGAGGLAGTAGTATGGGLGGTQGVNASTTGTTPGSANGGNGANGSAGAAGDHPGAGGNGGAGAGGPGGAASGGTSGTKGIGGAGGAGANGVIRIVYGAAV